MFFKEIINLFFYIQKNRLNFNLKIRKNKFKKVLVTNSLNINKGILKKNMYKIGSKNSKIIKKEL